MVALARTLFLLPNRSRYPPAYTRSEPPSNLPQSAFAPFPSHTRPHHPTPRTLTPRNTRPLIPPTRNPHIIDIQHSITAITRSRRLRRTRIVTAFPSHQVRYRRSAHWTGACCAKCVCGGRNRGRGFGGGVGRSCWRCWIGGFRGGRGC